MPPISQDMIEATIQGTAKGFYATTGKVTIANNNRLKVWLANPTNSNVRLHLFSWIISNGSSSFQWCDHMMNPTTGLLTSTLVPAKNVVWRVGNANNDSKAQFRFSSGTTAFGGGTLIDSFGLPPASRTIVDESILILEPGMSMGFDCLFATATTARIIIYYWEG